MWDESPVGNWFLAHRIQLGAYLVQSFTINPDSPQDNFNGPVTWTDRSNEYQFNQRWFYLTRPTDTTLGSDWDIGGRFDFTGGSDSRFFTSSGTMRDINGSRSFYGVAIPQLYAEVAYRRLKVMLGHFISPVGYNTVNSSLNFFNTIPYTYQYGEPFTHTGALATWEASEFLTLGGGITQGWNTTTSTSSRVGGLALLSYKLSPVQNLSFVAVFGEEPSLSTSSDGYSQRYLQTLVYSHQLSCNLNYVAQTDFGTQTNATATGHTARWYGLNQYLFYQQNTRWTWGIGGEWFRDEEGFRVGGILPLPPTNDPDIKTRGLSLNRNGYAGSFFQVTMGPRWTPYQFLVVRPNLRFDWYTGADNNPGNLKPFDDGSSNFQAILGLDAILQF